MRRLRFAILLLLSLHLSKIAFAKEYDFEFNDSKTLAKDTTLEGTVYVKGKIIVPKGITLTIKPGATITFEPQELANVQDEDFPVSIMVEGSIIAIGTKENPITFTMTQQVKNPLREITIIESDNCAFENCKFYLFTWAMHIHKSTVTIKDSLFENLYGGIRFMGGKVTIANNNFVNNELSLRFWQSAPVIEKNRFKDVGTAIFIREKGEGTVISNNTFSGIKEYFIKLGEAQEGNIFALDNDFGAENRAEISQKIYDKEDDEYIGAVIFHKPK